MRCRTSGSGTSPIRPPAAMICDQWFQSSDPFVFTEEILALARNGDLDRVGFVRACLAGDFTALRYPASCVPNRVPDLPSYERRNVGSGFNVGIFAEPFWRKNVVTQLGAVALLDDATAHVMRRPDVDYLDRLRLVDHGENPWDEFVSLQPSTDVNLYASLSECHPLSPSKS